MGKLRSSVIRPRSWSEPEFSPRLSASVQSLCSQEPGKLLGVPWWRLICVVSEGTSWDGGDSCLRWGGLWSRERSKRHFPCFWALADKRIKARKLWLCEWVIISVKTDNEVLVLTWLLGHSQYFLAVSPLLPSLLCQLAHPPSAQLATQRLKDWSLCLRPHFFRTSHCKLPSVLCTSCSRPGGCLRLPFPGLSFEFCR